MRKGPQNRLALERSPYLLQHAGNPVDWYPWSEAAFELARREDRPIFLSLGYSTCHWCHVMERESFENPSIAALLNEHYVCVKVDREERPDLDALYMKATQLLTGRGGWPNSVWLTPDGRPWFAGTYFPPEDAGLRAGFRTILVLLAQAWRERRHELEEQADRITNAMAQIGDAEDPAPPHRSLLDRAGEGLRASHDERWGGFGPAPKFPPYGALALLFAEYEQTSDPSLLEMVKRCLDAMIQGGIHDQLGGGFHRYSTDTRWFLPHFEKMLYDNAQILGALAKAFRLTGEARYRRAAEGIVDWLSREMLDPGGGFYSALDADSEGEEGRFYLWTRAELLELLGEDGPWFAELCGATEEGNWLEETTGRRPGTNILHLPFGLPADLSRYDDARALLRERRAARPRPLRDDKVLTSWNALMISALLEAASAFERPDWRRLAIANADFLLRELRASSSLLRSWRAGAAGIEGYLDDHAFLTLALLDLHEATGEARWLREALDLANVMLLRFEDTDGGFYFTADSAEDLILRERDPYDQAIPSGNAAAARVLIRLYRLRGEVRWRERARACLGRFTGPMARAPRSTEGLLLALTEYLALDAGDPPGWKRKGPLRARLERKGDAFSIRVAMDEGWHINSTEPRQEHLRPSYLSLNGGELLHADWPKPQELYPEFSREPISVYSGEFELRGRLRVEHGALSLHFQPCDDTRCLAPDSLLLEFEGP